MHCWLVASVFHYCLCMYLLVFGVVLLVCLCVDELEVHRLCR